MSPMIEYSNKFSNVFFPPDGPKDRFQYFHDLTVVSGERVDYATCVFCSMTVNGIVNRQATTLWGNVTVEAGGTVVDGIHVNGGRINLLPGSGVGGHQLYALGGSVDLEPGADAQRSSIDAWPGYFYPGQRSWPVEGIFFFSLAILSAALCASRLVSESSATRMQEALQRPLSSAIFGVLMLALPWILLIIAGYSVYLFFPLAFLIFLATPLVFCILLAIGIAAVSGFIGSLLGFSDRMEARIAGAALLVGLMLIPVLGFLIMLAILTLALGVVLTQCLWPALGAKFARRTRIPNDLNAT
jgi:hypothetical protein